jgi:hypothetical protein
MHLHVQAALLKTSCYININTKWHKIFHAFEFRYKVANNFIKIHVQLYEESFDIMATYPNINIHNMHTYIKINIHWTYAWNIYTFCVVALNLNACFVPDFEIHGVMAPQIYKTQSLRK